MRHLYEALEQCLAEIERGADVDTVLFQRPELADELRPLLEASIEARGMAVPEPSAEAVRRNRAKVLQHAAQMREARVKPRVSHAWFASLRRLAVMVMIVALVFVSGTGLVRAASETLPGDNLYPVKRTWEGVRVLFTFDAQKREALEFEQENRRLEELRELFTMGRSVKVDFAGYVTRQNADAWRVAGIPVLITSRTRLPDEQVVVGAAVRVRGQTQGDGSVVAERIQLLSPGANVPVVGDDSIEEEENKGQEQEVEDNSGKGSGGEATQTPQPRKTSFEGAVSAMETHLWIVNGIVVNVGNAEIKGTLRIGALAKVEGYFNSSGVFIAEKIEFQDGGSGGGSGSDSNNNNNNNNNDNNSNGSNDNDDNNNNNNANDDNGNDD